AIAAIESGYVQREIQEASYAYQQAIDDGKKVIVGVNKFVQGDEEPQMIFRVNPEAERAQIESLARVRKERDQPAVDATLSRLDGGDKVAAGTGRLLGPQDRLPLRGLRDECLLSHPLSADREEGGHCRL